MMAANTHAETSDAVSWRRGFPIVGVFGSDRDWTLDKAQAIGTQLALRDCVVLTGADRVTNLDTVKERAVDGVEAARNTGVQVGAWVGVARDRSPREPEVLDDHSIVLHPGFNHKRNYLEGQMCDAAIALHGRSGTRSEVVFSLAAGRPVVFVADKVWPEHLPRQGQPSRTDMEWLVDHSRSAVEVDKPSGDTDLDGWLDRTNLLNALATRPLVYRHVLSTATEADIVTAMLDLLKPVSAGGFTGALPQLGGDLQVETWNAYDSWLRGLGAEIPDLT